MKSLIFVFVALIIASCASTKNTKVVITPAGNWDYSITGTPEGDFSGVMIIVAQDKIYTAKLNGSGGELGGELYYSGTSVLFDATLAGEEMVGTMSAGGMNFPFKATRQK
jgi:hypothetical protein